MSDNKLSDNKLNIDELIGVTIAGRYRIISRLGAGGMGVAYRAWDEQAGRPVVIKIPKKAFLEDPTFAERFALEIRLLQGLSHPHIVPIVDVGEHEGLPYVVMRFLPGGSLSDRRLRYEDRKARPNPPGMLHLWLPALADALDHVHASGVVHRDVKPGNIFFDAFWGAFLGDFGIAKIVEESESFDREHTLTATSMGIGTPDYMAPELFTPKPAVDGRVDQYALAVTIYEMLSGSRPFTGTTAHIVVEVTTMPTPRLEGRARGLPSSLVEAVHRGLAKKPGERFPTCREFAAAVLQDVAPLADEPDVARLLCPNLTCLNLLKLPISYAGRQGKCPKCKDQMEVADDLGALWLLDEARRQRESTASVIGMVFDSDSADPGSAIVEDSLREFQPVSGPTPVGRSRRRPRTSIIAWLDRHGLAVAGVMTVLAAVSWLVMLFGGDVDDGKDAKIKALAQQVSELTRQLDSVSTAKEEAETGLEAARTALKATQAETQELKTQLTANSSPAVDPSLSAEAVETLAQPPLENSIGMKLKLIPPGTFMMGSEAGEADEKPVHEVRITKPFYLGVTEVTNAQWKRVMGGEPPSKWKDDDRPVEMVSWNDAAEFCRKLSGMPEEKKAGRVYRLPTEAEWEYACRAGTETPWTSGDAENLLGGVAWFGSNSGGQTHAVGQKKPNAWSLYDMHGNVWEWCGDWFGSYADQARADPRGPIQGSSRVLRGANWHDSAWNCRSAFRHWLDPSSRSDSLGFRLALSPAGSTPPEAGEPGGSKAEPATGVASPSGQNPIPKNAELAEILARPPLVNSIRMKLKLIPTGTFMMGSTDGDSNEKPVHEVRITKPFYIGVYEVTNRQWIRVMAGVPPSNWKDADRPVEKVSWDDANAFCQKLSERPEERAADRIYRLPTEAEWEYACRASTTTRWASGDAENLLGGVAYFGSNSGDQTHLVGKKRANAWGLHDMHGNVWEWCSDWQGAYSVVAIADSQGPTGGSVRVARGGSWSDAARSCRSAGRGRGTPTFVTSNLGFRLAMSTSDTTLLEADK